MWHHQGPALSFPGGQGNAMSIFIIQSMAYPPDTHLTKKNGDNIQNYVLNFGKLKGLSAKR